MHATESSNVTPHASGVVPLPTLVQEQVWDINFMALMRWLDAKTPAQQPRVGHAKLPNQEIFRLAQSASLSFASREIDRVSVRAGRCHVELFGLGALGPNGAMPTFFTDWVRERVQQHDTTLLDFVNLFQHRALSLFARAGLQSQPCAWLDRPDQDRFGFYLESLAGTQSQERSSLPRRPRLAAAAAWARGTRSADALAQTLSHYFKVPVQVREYVLRWLDIAPHERTALGRGATYPVLGKGAFAGARIADRQHQIAIVLGPLTWVQYMSFTPGRSNLQALADWVRSFMGLELRWQVQVYVHAHHIQPARLDGLGMLGCNAWLAKPTSTKQRKPASPGGVAGMVYEPCMQ